MHEYILFMIPGFSQTSSRHRVPSLHINYLSLEQFSNHLSTNGFCYPENKLTFTLFWIHIVKFCADWLILRVEIWKA